MSELKVMTLSQKDYTKRSIQTERIKRARKRARIRRKKKIIRLTCIFTGIFIFLVILLLFLLFQDSSSQPSPVGITAIDIKTEEINLSPITIVPANDISEEIVVNEDCVSAQEIVCIEEQTQTVESVECVIPETIFYDVPISDDLQQYIYDVAKEYDVEVPLIIAVIEHESNFDPNARSESGDSGLMQVNDINLETLKEELGIDNIFDPYQNILGGTYLLSKCLKDVKGDIHPALMSYNMGRSNAKECWSKGIYSSKYSRAVYSLYENKYQR